MHRFCHVEHPSRMRDVVGSNPAQGSSVIFIEKSLAALQWVHAFYPSCVKYNTHVHVGILHVHVRNLHVHVHVDSKPVHQVYYSLVPRLSLLPRNNSTYDL